MNPILTDPATAHALEEAEALHLQRQAQTWGRLEQRAALVLALCGGVAAFTDPAFGRKLNHATGMGMGEPLTAQALARIEAESTAARVDTEIDLCPHADPGALALLGARGYAVNAFSNTYVAPLAAGAAGTPTAQGAIEIIDERAAVADAFLAASVDGFAVQAQRRPTALLEALARIALARSDSTLFIARLEGVIVGSAGMSLLETRAGLVAHCYIASTLPGWRGRGVQSALLKARLAAARRAGCHLAQITARPANASARNAERAGFRLAYTKATFTRRHACPG